MQKFEASDVTMNCAFFGYHFVTDQTRLRSRNTRKNSESGVRL